jgi:phosphatidylglycerol lysyltransferase
MVHRARNFFQSPWWKSLLPLIFVVLFGFFLSQQREELHNVYKVLRTSRLPFLMGGLGLVLFYMWIQGRLFQASYRTIHKQLTIQFATQLYLKRFFLGTFLPAGFTVAQFAYQKGLKEQGINDLENHLASTIYLLICSIVYAVLLLPTLVFLFFTNRLTGIETTLAALCLAVIVLFLWALTHVTRQRGISFKVFSTLWPDLPSFVASWKDKSLDRTYLKKAVFYGFVLYFINVAMFLLIFRAFAVPDSFLLAIISFVVSFLILYLSPAFQGLGLVEISLVGVLKQYGIDGATAVTITILYRIFQLWLPLLISGLVILYQRARRKK